MTGWRPVDEWDHGRSLFLAAGQGADAFLSLSTLLMQDMSGKFFTRGSTRKRSIRVVGRVVAVVVEGSWNTDQNARTMSSGSLTVPSMARTGFGGILMKMVGARMQIRR